ncbi:MutS-related protein [Nocardia camponoti]|uniref:DNA mismatch repair protein MutS n=1 Tax=Nocardia camponoti TaxID=1616106 RepID=A0A917Q8Z6_9NOCA|nr:DNA mismatch repair protein [Nocardia camponoti]GGK35369.1 DNA mismatch repair protein MutS [Nocardia camponoti]
MRVNLLAPATVAVAPIVTDATALHDLGLTTLCDNASDDPVMQAALRSALLTASADPDVISYRHAVLAETHTQHAVVRELYDIATAATLVRRRKVGPAHRASGKLLLAVDALTELLTHVRALRKLVVRHAHRFSSPGFVDLMNTVTTALTENYLDEAEAQVRALNYDAGIQLSARLGDDNGIADVVLHAPTRRKSPFARRDRDVRAFHVADEPDPEYDPLARLRDYAVSMVAAVLNDAAAHVHDFFTRLRDEVAFYLGCVSLHDRLRATGYPLCLPTALPIGSTRLASRQLRDPMLCLTMTNPVVSNDLDADARHLIVVTGANSGGKSTLLRGIGAAQLMMQAGMYVVADSFAADVRTQLLTHYTVDEDRGLSRGQFVDELARMSAIVDKLSPHGMLLCNESFSTTGEYDAAQIAGPLLDALTESGVRVVFVTHLHGFAAKRYRTGVGTDLFLGARTETDGTRSYVFTPAVPESTSHAIDIYEQIFGPTPGRPEDR